MKKTIILICLISLALAGCPNPPKEMPENFSFSYESGAMHLEWGHYIFNVDEKGNAVFLKEKGFSLMKEYEFTISEEERKQVYNSVIENGFFYLNGSYQDPAVMDGGFDRIKVHADTDAKTVSVVNTHVEQFSKIEAEIVKVLKNHVNDPFDFGDLMLECNSKENECIQEELPECNEWKEFCGWDLEEFSSEYCDKLQNRSKCIEYCTENICKEEVCDTLMFEAIGCSECGPGCCSYCNELDSCAELSGCEISWIHPAGESWQFAGCENTNLCAGTEELCNYLFLSYQGYRYHSLIEENSEKAKDYELFSDSVQELYNEECE